MKTMIVGALALFVALPTIASAAETELVIRTHRHHQHNNVKIVNDEGQRLHHRRHGTVAFYDHGKRYHRPDTVVTGSISTRHHHRRYPVVIERDIDD